VLTRSTTNCLRSSGNVCTASAASSIARNSSARACSDSRTFDTLTASRGSTDNSIGPSIASVRWRSVFIQSIASPL
jgi:hypothetical protein